jgi:hypothetical protein
MFEIKVVGLEECIQDFMGNPERNQTTRKT